MGYNSAKFVLIAYSNSMRTLKDAFIHNIKGLIEENKLIKSNNCMKSRQNLSQKLLNWRYNGESDGVNYLPCFCYSICISNLYVKNLTERVDVTISR